MAGARVCFFSSSEMFENKSHSKSHLLGIIRESSLVLGDFQVKEQAFGENRSLRSLHLVCTHIDDDIVPVSLTSEEELPFPPGVSGVFGLGPRFASEIRLLLNLSSTAEPAVYQIEAPMLTTSSHYLYPAVSISLSLTSPAEAASSPGTLWETWA